MASDMIQNSVSKLKNLELFLLKLRYKEGRLRVVEGNQPLLLDDPQSAWIVYAGTVDVFSVPVTAGDITGTRKHLFRAVTGQLLLGVDGRSESKFQSEGQKIALLVSGTPGTTVLQLPLTNLLALVKDLEYEALIVAMINDWITALASGVFQQLLPKSYQLLKAGQSLNFSLGDPSIVTPKKGVVWLQMEDGQGFIEGEADLAFTAAQPLLPLASFMWLEISPSCRLGTTDTLTVLATHEIGQMMAQFHRFAMHRIILQQQRSVSAERERLRQRAETERQVMENALLQIESALDEDVTYRKPREVTSDDLFAACSLVGDAMGMVLVPPRSAVMQSLWGYDLLEKIAQTGRFNLREVMLRQRWWQEDNGPLLAFMKDDDRPVALISKSASKYELIDPNLNSKIVVDKTTAQQLGSVAYRFYKPFPNEVLNAWKLAKFGLADSKTDIIRLLAIGVTLGVLRLAPPIATGLVFNNYIPSANVSGLVQTGIALLIIALALGLFQIAQGIAVLRIQSKMDVSLQAALWDRLLGLPIPFFRQYSAGDLGGRVMGVTAIRRILSGHVINTFLTFIFTSFNLLLLFYYSPFLATVAIGLTILALCVTLGVSVVYIKFQRQVSEGQGVLSGLVLQLITGIVKLRITASESQAFAQWTNEFVEQRKLQYKARQTINLLTIFNAVFPLFATLVLFALVAYSTTISDLSAGDFLAFNLAFTQFLLTWVQVSSSLAAFTSTIPIYERLKPILEAMPEVDEVKVAPSALKGAIEINHVSFRYQDNLPLVLKDVSLSIAPGELVAFVGPSGSGKSTLLRLLLGFDSPETGEILFDGQDLDDLDIREVRRQLGVVLQNSALMTGEIYENIVGASNLTVDDAWEAARMVGLAPDLEKMPMGMSTFVTGQGGTLSGGQRQRILIARAIVNRPRILFFDEATSALDNNTQEVVSRSLEGLQATRVLIAHRLSTIMNADRIYVFDQGQIVQSGTYSELIEQPGPFADLSKRQMV